MNDMSLSCVTSLIVLVQRENHRENHRERESWETTKIDESVRPVNEVTMEVTGERPESLSANERARVSEP